MGRNVTHPHSLLRSALYKPFFRADNKCATYIATRKVADFDVLNGNRLVVGKYGFEHFLDVSSQAVQLATETCRQRLVWQSERLRLYS